jgi:hypothetical protein
MSGPGSGKGMCNLMKEGVLDLLSVVQLCKVLAQTDRVIIVPAVSKPALRTIELERPLVVEIVMLHQIESEVFRFAKVHLDP